MKTNICEKCLAAQEKIPAVTQYDQPPPNCCIVCWVRYGRFVPACKTLKELQDED